ncbi:uncharacterized protein DFL_001334 [Arthrobotrys flagrans]|uniref:DUF7924 domain-containing protein n=1 Tax=Arthrobotrys flagrans TaxID=97331 RepID=A0A437AGS9_ARTFL|nr:hypothetical protein DFL_001334 [Arthrobotrys flagrans]
MATHPISTPLQEGQKSVSKNKHRDTGECEENFRRKSKEPRLGAQTGGTDPNLEEKLAEWAESKRQRESIPPASGGPPRKRFKSVKDGLDEGVELSGEFGGEDQDPIYYWARTSRWPKDYAEQKRGYRMGHSLLLKRQASGSIRRKRSETELSSATPTDQKPRESKSIPYNTERYDVFLTTQGVFMEGSDLGITDESRKTFETLLAADQLAPIDSLFRDDVFEETLRKVKERNEARVMRDITPLVVPSAETLAKFGSKHLKILVETYNDGWDGCVPLTSPRPQPDYAVGFKEEAFTEKQFGALLPFLSDRFYDRSCFMATYYMFFPFLSCEVKCSGQPLEIADRQNAHSMWVAVRAVVELFKLVKREQELDREILAFSISHDHNSVRIYGHYPVINGSSVKYFRHPIVYYTFIPSTADKWTAYKFIKNVYDLWMPAHLKRLCSAIDQIPSGVGFNVTTLSRSSDFAQGSESASVRSDSGYTHSGDAIGADTYPNTSFAIPPPKKAKNADTLG